MAANLSDTTFTPSFSNIDFAPIGEAFQAPWDANQLIKAEPYIGCAGCIGETHEGDYCGQLPLCGTFAREDGVSVRFVAVEEG